MKTLFDLLERILAALILMGVQHKKVLSLKEAACYLDISKQKLYQMTSERAIAYSKPCERIFFSRDVLDSWALSNPVLSKEEIALEAISRNKKGKGKW